MVYEDLRYSYDENQDTIKYHKDSPSKANSKTYYRFYSTGTVYGFIYKDQDTVLNKDSFNPLNGGFGFVMDHKKNIIMDYSTINCGGFSKTGFEIRNDTLIMKHGSGGEGWRVLYYYKAVEVPKEWLDYPDDIH